eukprot:TRINITY_DN105025_c0_g1_i1.p2 TRINITY_DN105025_c0_g1~~TRINITY_DN105025_c0_g1_i1.p2  ORF type:complete len:317 (+),score=190.98 TRINITY_DN105025_c0_g1_i1:24-953(+)
MLIYGAMLSCVSPSVIMAALMSMKNPFVSPLEKRAEANAARAKFVKHQSDHLTLLNAFQQWREILRSSGKRAAYDFCNENFLSYKTLETVDGLVSQLLSSMVDIGFISRVRKRGGGGGRLTLDSIGDEYNRNSDNVQVLAAVLCAGLYPNVIRVQYPPEVFEKMIHGYVPKPAEAKQLKFFTKGDPGRVFLHPSSVNFTNNVYRTPYLVYLKMMATSRVYVFDCSMVNPYALLLFGGDVSVNTRDKDNQLVMVDDWVRFRANARVAALVKGIRKELDALLVQKIRSPLMPINESPLVQAILTLLSAQGF